FGQAIGQKQAIAFKLADMAIEIDAIRLLAWEAAWRIDRALPATREAVLARQYAAERALKITDDAVQVLGGHGYIRDHPVELWLRNARGLRPWMAWPSPETIPGETTMIDFELSDAVKNMQQMTHMVAEQAMRPISRHLDEHEHEPATDFWNMMWNVSGKT